METLKLIIKKNTLWSLFSIVSYKTVLDLFYYFVISPVWAYAKFDLDLNILKLVESYFLLFVIFTMLPKSLKILSHVMIWILVLISYVPLLTLFAFMDQPREYMYAIAGFWILVFLLLKIPTVSFVSFKSNQSKIILFLIFTCLTFIVFFLTYRYFGFKFNFDLTKAYEIRSKYVEMKIPFSGYLFNWWAYIVGPVFFAIFLNEKKWFFLSLVVFLQILLFSVTGNKGFLFTLPFVLVLMWVVPLKNPAAWFSVGLTGMILLGMLSYWLVNDKWISSIFGRRVLLVPAQLSFFYYDFFSKNGPLFLSQHRIFRNFIDYPYHLSPPHLIGEVYFNHPQTAANNGIYGDAFMNFGFAGFILWSIFLATILRLIDIFSKNKDIKITVAAIAMPAIFLINSALLTSLLTHGLLLTLLLLYLLPKRKII